MRFGGGGDEETCFVRARTRMERARARTGARHSGVRSWNTWERQRRRRRRLLQHSSWWRQCRVSMSRRVVWCTLRHRSTITCFVRNTMVVGAVTAFSCSVSMNQRIRTTPGVKRDRSTGKRYRSRSSVCGRFTKIIIIIIIIVVVVL